MRSGSQLRSLPAFQRLCAPGPALAGRGRLGVGLRPLAPRVPVERAVAVGLELLEQLGRARRREAARHADVVQHAVVVVEAEQQRADAVAVLVHAEPADDAVGGAQVLHLLHRPLALFVRDRRAAWRPRRRAPRPRSARTTACAASRSVVAGVSCTGGRRVRERVLEARAPLAERLLAEIAVALGEQVEGDERRPASPPRASRRATAAGWMRNERQVEVEPALGGDHDLAVDDAALGQVGAQRLEEIGEVARERLLVAAPDLDVVAVAEDDARGSRPTSARRGSRRPCRRSSAARAPASPAWARPGGSIGTSAIGRSVRTGDDGHEVGIGVGVGQRAVGPGEAAHAHAALGRARPRPRSPTASHGIRAQPVAGRLAGVVEGGDVDGARLDAASVASASSDSCWRASSAGDRGDDAVERRPRPCAPRRR